MCATIVLIAVVLCAGVGFLTEPAAQAKATIALVTPPAKSVVAPGVQGDASMARYTAQRAAFIKSDALLKQVAASLKRDDLTKLRRQISATPSTTSNTISISAEAGSEAEARSIASATISAYRSLTAKDVQRRTDAAVNSINASALGVAAAGANGAVAPDSVARAMSQLAIDASEIRVASATFGDGVESVITPRADATRRPSLSLREAALGLVLGLFLAATAAWIRADREDSAEVAEEAAKARIRERLGPTAPTETGVYDAVAREYVSARGH
jgi:capsular polysaccharide biosynthesis protein